MNALQFARRTSLPAMLAFLGLTVIGCSAPTRGGGSRPDGSGGDGSPSATNQNGNSNPGGANSDGLTDVQKLRAEQITSVFENDTIELQYAYIENINDGRGFTAGRAGFTSGTGDLILVVERYTAVVPGNELAVFLDRLGDLAELAEMGQNSGSVEGLEGLPAAWMRAADDPRFRAVQDEVSDELYYRPAVVRWQGVGLTTALSLAALYDANIQHGEGDDPDGLPAMIDRATASAGGSPATGVVAEATWLAAFLDARRATLSFAFNPETRAAWALGADRGEVFRTLLEDGNFNLNGPIVIDTAEHTATVP